MDLDLSALCNDIQQARLTLRFPRERVVAMVRQYAGGEWSEESSDKSVPCNLLAIYVDVVGRKLIADNPRAMLSTDAASQRPMVKALESWINKETKKQDLKGTLERCVLNAMFSVGVCKVGIATPADSASNAWNLQAGDCFAESIDLDDFVYDIHARHFKQVSYMGHRYRAPLEVLKKSPQYHTKDLIASEDKFYNLQGDERLSVLGRGYYSNQEEFEPMVDLWEIYLPRHRLVVTLLDDALTGAAPYAKGMHKAIRIQNWLGPPSGPYHILAVGNQVPGNPMPKAPCQDLYPLHIAVNRILRKLLRQADRQKEVLPVNGQQSEDGNRTIATNDGEAFLCNNEPPRPVAFGGPSPQNFQMFGAMKDLFSWLGGNIDVQGGLSPEAKTLGQERLLAQSSSATISSMQDRTIAFTESVLRAKAWFYYHHPQKKMRSRYSVPGVEEVGINRMVTPRGGPGMNRNMPFDLLDINVDPYSLPHSSPAEKLATMNEVVTKIFIPMAQLFQQQGMTLDANKYFQIVSEWTNLPELKQVITMQEPPAVDGSGGGMGGAGSSGGEAGPQPSETTRNYVRHSQGNASQHGKDLGRANAMKNVPSQNGQPAMS